MLFATFIGEDRQRLTGSQQFSRPEQMIRVARAPMAFVPDSERFVEKNSAGRQAADQGRKQGPVQVVGDDDQVEAFRCEGPVHLTVCQRCFQIVIEQCGLPGEIRHSVKGAVKKGNSAVPAEKQPPMASTAAGKVKDPVAGGCQGRKAANPVGGRQRVVTLACHIAP